MMKSSIVFLLMSMCITSFGQHQSDEMKIKEAANEFSALYMQGDHRGMANLYTEDAVLMSPNQDVIYGREAIYKFWSRDTTYHQMIHKTKSDRLEIVGDYAYDNGYWYSKAKWRGEQQPLASGKYLIIWRKNKNGEWQMYHDIWNNRARGWEEREKDIKD